jgi:hypothetical protein
MAAVSGAAFAMLRNLLRSYGLDELSDWAYQRFVEGKTTDEIMIEIEDQPAFKRKYAAIFDRRAKGLPPVSVAEIVEYRRSALALEQFYDLPEGMVSGDEQVNQAVTGDISFDELSNRVQRGALIAYQQPPEVTAWLQENYGVGEGGLIAFFTDPELSMPFIERAATSALVAGASQRSGFGALTRGEAEQLSIAGVSADQAGQAFGQLAEGRELLTGLAGSGENDIGRQTQIDYAAGLAPAASALARRARGRRATFEESGSFSGPGLVSGTDR